MPAEKPKRSVDPDLAAIADESRRRSGIGFWTRFYQTPFWLLIFIVIWVYVVHAINTNADYQAAWQYVRGNYFTWLTNTLSCTLGTYCPENYSPVAPEMDGIVLTVMFAVVSYAVSLVIGLIIGIIRANPPLPPSARSGLVRWLRSAVHLVVYNVVTFYVEFMRGIPSLVFILVAAFVLLPAFRDSLNNGLIAALNEMGLPVGPLRIRGIDPITGIASLSLIYGAYLSEVFRAGIQGISKGQVEAARSLGMTYFQTMRHVVVPQAVRAVLPPLGNDFIAIIKDTALLTILGINDITQLTRKWVGTTFKYPETYLVLSTIYLTMTIVGSMLVQLMERWLRRHER
jgi:polar amino acid transport system permease protein